MSFAMQLAATQLRRALLQPTPGLILQKLVAAARLATRAGEAHVRAPYVAASLNAPVFREGRPLFYRREVAVAGTWGRIGEAEPSN